MALPLNHLWLFVHDEQPERAAAVLAAEGRDTMAHKDCGAILLGLAACLNPVYRAEAANARRSLCVIPKSSEAAVYIAAADIMAEYCAFEDRPVWQTIHYVRRIAAVAEYSRRTEWLFKLAKAIIAELEALADEEVKMETDA